MRAELVLPVPAGPGEQVRLALPAARDGVAQRPHDVVLPLQLGEPARPVAAVQGGGGHVAEDTDGVSRAERATGVPRGDRAYNYLVPVVPARTGVPGRTLRLVLAVPAAVAGALLIVGTAAAQQVALVESSPADGEELAEPPSEIVLTFDSRARRRQPGAAGLRG